MYVSQALAWILGGLPPGGMPAEVSYYAFQASGETPRLTMRIDRWEPSTLYGAAWTHATRTSGDDQATTTWWSEDGRLVRRERPDGSVMVPTPLEMLRRRWSESGLRLGERRR